ncbi:MAG: TonB-dependent receptor plug domain-containing protein, partial [Gammaproteobacteria bacterium]
MRKPRLSLLALMCAASYSVAHAEDVTSLETIQVEGERFTPSTQVIDMADDTAAPAADAGSLLRDLPGVDGIRMGGKGIDPVIRGQQGNRLNILTDGAYIFGACPNRMDPPTAYMAPELFDRITVIEGMQSVVYGPGGSGGTVLFERITPRFAEGEHARGKAGIGYRDNGNVRSGYADLTAGGTQGFVRVYGNKAEADNYKDGTGTEVRSAYKDDGYGAILGWTPDDNTRLEVSYDGLRERDVLYAGAGMDSPKSDADILRARFSREAMSGPITAVHAEVYQSWV